MLRELLESKKCFKLVLGAGNEDIENVEKLIRLYTKAGCKFFDLSMNVEIAKIARKASPDGIFCFSYGIKEDPHTLKACITESCVKCRLCEKVCIQNAINNCVIDQKKCIGCLKCTKVCSNNAIKTYSKPKNLKEILPEILSFKPDCIELHATGSDETEIDENWEYMTRNYNGMMSLCTDRSQIGDKSVIERIKRLIKDRKPYTTIVQADGNPMSGGVDDYKTTLQAVAMAEVVHKGNLPVYLLLSGGTNSKTYELATICGLDINGVSIGSYARKIVKNHLEDEQGLKLAKNLVNSVIS